jgi:hypothetical protein
MLEYVRPGQARLGHVRPCQLKMGVITVLVYVRPRYVRIGEVMPGYKWLGQFNPD